MKALAPCLALALTLALARAETPLRVEGSNTFGEKLGPALVSAFEQRAPGVDVILKRPGTGPGLAALLAGRSDIAPASRPANGQELVAAKKAGVKLQPWAIGAYGVALVVNGSNPVHSLKPSQVRAIFTGKITNWKKVGGPDQPIRLLVLDSTTGARAGFQDLAMKGEPYAAGASAFPDYAGILGALQKDPWAIGYAGMGPTPSGTRALLVGGQPANAGAIYERVYPYANALYLYTLAGKETPTALKFIKFVLSREGQAIMQREGYAPRVAVAPDAAPPSVRGNSIP